MALTQPGARDGQTKVIREDGGGMAYSWSAARWLFFQRCMSGESLQIQFPEDTERGGSADILMQDGLCRSEWEKLGQVVAGPDAGDTMAVGGKNLYGRTWVSQLKIKGRGC